MRKVIGSYKASRGRLFAIGSAAATVTLGVTILFVAAANSSAQDQRSSPSPGTSHWWQPGSGESFPAAITYGNAAGKLEILNASGPIDTKGHPFFTPLGTNGRACVTCHQPADAMSLSVRTITERWRATAGKDPLFASVDGSNCPNLPQDQESSHSLLLNRGLFRVFLPWPPKAADGTAIKPEFTIEVIRDPTGCNSDPKYGLNSANPTISVYRRPRVAANLKYVLNGGGLFSPKQLAMPMGVDPESGARVSMNMMADARALTLKLQANDAALGHEEAKAVPTKAQLQQLQDFELQVFAAQSIHHTAGPLTGGDGPTLLGPESLARERPGILGDNLGTPVFGSFEAWKKAPVPGDSPEQREARESIARGFDVFFKRPFWIRDSQHINSIGLGNPVKRTCATCHNSRMTGQDLVSGWVDVGTTNLPWAGDQPDLPLFKITCDPTVPGHNFLGRVIYTHDPGRALISGKCFDVGTIVMAQFRGLAARAPYFSNGMAGNLRELVDFYDRRYDIGFTEQEKQDLVNFLGTL